MTIKDKKIGKKVMEYYYSRVEELYNTAKMEMDGTKNEDFVNKYNENVRRLVEKQVWDEVSERGTHC